MHDSLELIREMGVDDRTGAPPPAAAPRNPLWRQIQADIYGCDVHTLNSTEGPAFGVALAGPGRHRRVRLGPGGMRRHHHTSTRPEVDPQGQHLL